MDNETNVYPDFVPNQVLTNNQLNQLRKYLDHQNRLGRVRLTGTGIICGLNVHIDNKNTITISNGFGISSEGYLIELDSDKAVKTSLTHWKNYTDPNLHEDGTIAYENWQKAGNKKSQRDILELVSDAKGAKKISSQQLSDRVLVLYLEQRNEQLDSCLVTDCDSKGVNVHFSIRVLLVKQDALQAVATCESPKGQLIHIPRLHTKLPLAEVVESAQINDAYQTIVENMFEEVLIKINESYKKYETLLNLDEDIPDILKDLKVILENPSQYTWDILNDIADAYNEFITHACEILSPCLAEQDFPRHLMLGAMNGAVAYRNQFIASPIRNVQHDAIEQIRKLFLRILVLASSISLEKPDGIAITPSHTKLSPLGKRALPFYYDPKIEPYWQPQLCCTTVDVWSYHFQKKLAEFDYANASFMRIEGHLGGDCDAVIKHIRELQQKFNLEFDLLTLEVKSEEESLVTLAQDIPGIEHTAGVVKGGTFILLCDDARQVVADFSLSGQIPCCRYQKTPEQPVERSNIGGHFTDENGGAFVGGKVVLKRPNSTFNREGKTDNKARYQFTNLQAGTYTVQASISKGQNENFVSDTKRVQLGADENKTVNLIGKLVQVERKGIIKGNVLAENASGRPTAVPKAIVKLSPGNKKLTAGNKGEFSFTNLAPDTYSLQASIKINFGSGSQTVSTDPVSVKLVSGATKTISLLFKQTSEKTGSLDILLVDSANNNAISKATVSIRHEADRQATASLNKPSNTRSKRYLFQKIKTGKYSVSTTATGYKKSTRNITIAANKTAKHTIKLSKSGQVINPVVVEPIVIDHRRPRINRPIFSGHTERRGIFSAEDLQLKSEQVYAERLVNYQAALDTIPASVKRSISAKLAHEFLHETVANEAADEVIFKQYDTLAIKSLKTLASSNASLSNKEHYKSILSATSLALLDSLMMSFPETLDADAETAVRKVKQALNKAGIALTGFKKQWNAKQLKDELEVSSISKVTAILR